MTPSGDAATEVAAQERALLRLLFDAPLRARFARDRSATLDELEVPARARAPLLHVDLAGLALDAELRTRTLMASLCRSYPWTCTILGGLPHGAASLEEFLATPSLIEDPGTRLQSLGRFLAQVLEEAVIPEEARRLAQLLLELERARVDNAARARAALAAGTALAAFAAPSRAALQRGHVVVPDFVLVAELPFPTPMVETALGVTRPDDVWAHVRSGAVRVERFIALARAQLVPVTVVARAGSETGTAAEVKHKVAELGGRHGGLLASLRGTRTLMEHPSVERQVLEPLLLQGLLSVVMS